jgi:glycopeptide antibiotics resistance protein
MKRSYLQILLDLVFIIVFCGLAFLSLSRSFGVPEFAIYFELLFGSDKALHFFAGTVITFTIFRALSRLLAAKYINTLFFSLALSTLILTIDEFSQLANSYRNFDIYDLIASFSGLTLAAILLVIIYKFFIPQSKFNIENIENIDLR